MKMSFIYNTHTHTYHTYFIIMNNLHLHKVHFCPQIAGAKSRQAEIIGTAVSNKLQIQSNQAKRTSQEPINEFVIQKLNPLLVVDFRLISAFLYA